MKVTVQNTSGLQKTLRKELEGGLMVRVRGKMDQVEKNKYMEKDMKKKIAYWRRVSLSRAGIEAYSKEPTTFFFPF